MRTLICPRSGLVALAFALAFALPAAAQRPDVLALSPEAGERVPEDAVLVAATILGDVAALSGMVVTIEIDDRDVTAEAEVRGDVVTWRPRAPLAHGPHRVVVTARTPAGATLATGSWTFTVTAATPTGAAVSPRALTVGLRPHGSLIVEGSSNSVSGAGAALRRQEEDFLPLMWLNAGGVIRPGWRYATRVHVSGYESKDQQPVNRYRLDLRTPALSLGIGDVNPVFQDLILSGRRVRGVQADLRAGPLRLGVVSGQSRRGIPGLLNPLNKSEVGRLGTYQQDLIAVRPAVGSGTRFQLGLTALRVRDDVNSIPDLRTAALGADGATRSANAQPKDNLVAGIDATLRMLRGRVLLHYETAVSLLANDITGGPLTEAGIDSLLDASGKEGLGIDPSAYERWFILNASLIPLDPRGLTNLAQQARGSLYLGSHLIAVEWQSIGGSYHTLGHPGLQRDRQGIRIRDAFTMLDDALVVAAGYERDHDNLDDVKNATTTSVGTFATLAWQKSRDAVMLTAGARAGTRGNDLAAGTDGALDETSRSLSAGVSVPVPVLRHMHTRVSLSGFVVQRSDASNPTADTRDLYYLGGVQGETPERSSAFSLLLSMNQSELTGLDEGATNYYRLVTAGRHRVRPLWTALVDGTYTAARSPDVTSGFGPQYNRLELLGGGEYAWRRTALVTLTAGVISYADQRSAAMDTREFVVRLRLNQAF